MTGDRLDPELVRFLREEMGEMLPAGGEWQVTARIKVWRGQGGAETGSSIAWHFVAITGAVADAIRAAAPGRSAAWGSVPVEAAVGGTVWRTSVFPTRELGGFFLPLKAAVRKQERLAEGDTVTVTLRL